MAWTSDAGLLSPLHVHRFQITLDSACVDPDLANIDAMSVLLLAGLCAGTIGRDVQAHAERCTN